MSSFSEILQSIAVECIQLNKRLTTSAALAALRESNNAIGVCFYECPGHVKCKTDGEYRQRLRRSADLLLGFQFPFPLRSFRMEFDNGTTTEVFQAHDFTNLKFKTPFPLFAIGLTHQIKIIWTFQEYQPEDYRDRWVLELVEPVWALAITDCAVTRSIYKLGQERFYSIDDWLKDNPKKC